MRRWLLAEAAPEVATLPWTSYGGGDFTADGLTDWVRDTMAHVGRVRTTTIAPAAFGTTVLASPKLWLVLFTARLSDWRAPHREIKITLGFVSHVLILDRYCTFEVFCTPCQVLTAGQASTTLQNAFCASPIPATCSAEHKLRRTRAVACGVSPAGRSSRAVACCGTAGAPPAVPWRALSADFPPSFALQIPSRSGYWIAKIAAAAPTCAAAAVSDGRSARIKGICLSCLGFRRATKA